MKSAAIAFLGIFFASAAFAQSDEIRLGHFMSPQHPMDRFVMRPLSEGYNAAMEGRSVIQIYPAGELGKGPNQQFKRAVTGETDISFGLPGYTQNLFPVTTMFELPGLYTDPVTATEAIWDNIGMVQQDYERVKLLATWSNNPTVIISRDRPVRNFDDLRGMKVRVGNPTTAKIIEDWGGVPVTLPANQVYQSMSTGVIDAAYIGGSAILGFKLYEVGNFVTVNIPGAITTFYLVMNKERWEGLTDEERQMLDTMTGRELSIEAAQAYQRVGQRAISTAAENGVQVVTLNEFQLNAFLERFPYSTQGQAGN